MNQTDAKRKLSRAKTLKRSGEKHAFCRYAGMLSQRRYIELSIT